jgi:hypothetical protein
VADAGGMVEIGTVDIICIGTSNFVKLEFYNFAHRCEHIVTIVYDLPTAIAAINLDNFAYNAIAASGSDFNYCIIATAVVKLTCITIINLVANVRRSNWLCHFIDLLCDLTNG